MAKGKRQLAEEKIKAAKTVPELMAAVADLAPEDRNALTPLIYRVMERIIGTAV